MAKDITQISHHQINLIAKGTKITGTIQTVGDIRIDGELMGQLESNGKLVIGVSGNTDGEINSNSCEISGTHNGKLTIKELLTLTNTCNVSGEIVARKVSVEQGAFIIGTFAIGDDSFEKKS